MLDLRFDDLRLCESPAAFGTSAAVPFLRPAAGPSHAGRAAPVRPVRIWRISRGRSSPENSPRLFLLFRRQQIRALQFVQKFLGRPFRRVEIKPFFEISRGPCRKPAMTKRLRLRNERQRFCQFLLRADMRRHRRHDRNLRPPFLPPTPERKQQRRDGQCAKRPPKPFPAARNFHRRLDVADVVGGGCVAFSIHVGADVRRLQLVRARVRLLTSSPTNKKWFHPRSLRFSRFSKNFPSAAE